MRFLLLLSALLLAACGTPYVRDTGYGGYQDGPVEKNLYRVVYTAPNGMGQREVRDLALFRAAQVCRAQGDAAFVLARENNGTTRRLQIAPPEPPAYYETPVVSGPRVLWVPSPAWNSGVPESYATPALYTELYIRIYPDRAAAPKGDVYDADDLLSRLGAQYKLSPR